MCGFKQRILPEPLTLWNLNKILIKYMMPEHRYYYAEYDIDKANNEDSEAGT